MFRLVFLTFLGERRHDAPRTPAHDRRARHDAHAHGHGTHDRTDTAHLHDAPPAMALALIVLAIGSVAAGYIGVPHALGGHNALGAWLEPSFAARAVAGEALPQARAGGEAAAPTQARALELTLMGVSSVDRGPRHRHRRRSSG